MTFPRWTRIVSKRDRFLAADTPTPVLFWAAAQRHPAVEQLLRSFPTTTAEPPAELASTEHHLPRAVLTVRWLVARPMWHVFFALLLACDPPTHTKLTPGRHTLYVRTFSPLASSIFGRFQAFIGHIPDFARFPTRSETP